MRWISILIIAYFSFCNDGERQSEPVDDFDPNAIVVAGPSLRIRQTASLGADIVASVPFGEMIKISQRASEPTNVNGRRGQWRWVTTADGSSGWAFDYYLYYYDKAWPRTHNPSRSFYYQQPCSRIDYGDTCPTMVFDASDSLVAAFDEGAATRWADDNTIITDFDLYDCPGGRTSTYSFDIASQELTRVWLHAVSYLSCGDTGIDRTEHTICYLDDCTSIEEDRDANEIRLYSAVVVGDQTYEKGDLAERMPLRGHFEVVDDRTARHVKLNGATYSISTRHTLVPLPQ